MKNQTPPHRICKIFLPKIKLTNNINTPSPIKADSTEIKDKICLPMVIYKANTAKIIERVVAIAFPFVRSTNT